MKEIDCRVSYKFKSIVCILQFSWIFQKQTYKNNIFCFIDKYVNDIIRQKKERGGG